MTKHIPLEKTITNNILKYLNSLPRCRARKMPSGPYGSGWPDIICVYRGSAIFFEVKRPGMGKKSEPTELQRLELAKWSEAGAGATTIRSVEEAKDYMGVMLYCYGLKKLN